MAPGDDVGRDAGVVERVQRLVVDQDVAAAGAVLEFLDLFQQLPVLGEERVVGLPIAFDERMADEQLPAQRRVDAAVVDAAAGDDRQAVQR